MKENGRTTIRNSRHVKFQAQSVSFSNDVEVIASNDSDSHNSAEDLPAEEVVLATGSGVATRARARSSVILSSLGRIIE